MCEHRLPFGISFLCVFLLVEAGNPFVSDEPSLHPPPVTTTPYLLMRSEPVVLSPLREPKSHFLPYFQLALKLSFGDAVGLHGLAYC
jgi:hypothetical protein